MFLRLPRRRVPLLRVAVAWRWLLMAARLVVRLPRRPTMRTGRPSGSPSVWLMSLPSNGRHLSTLGAGCRFCTRESNTCTTHFALSCLVLFRTGPGARPPFAISLQNENLHAVSMYASRFTSRSGLAERARRALPLSRLSISQTETHQHRCWTGPDIIFHHRGIRRRERSEALRPSSGLLSQPGYGYGFREHPRVGTTPPPSSCRGPKCDSHQPAAIATAIHRSILRLSIIHRRHRSICERHLHPRSPSPSAFARPPSPAVFLHAAPALAPKRA
jgi:hypothetical protein